MADVSTNAPAQDNSTKHVDNGEKKGAAEANKDACFDALQLLKSQSNTDALNAGAGLVGHAAAGLPSCEVVNATPADRGVRGATEGPGSEIPGEPAKPRQPQKPGEEEKPGTPPKPKDETPAQPGQPEKPGEEQKPAKPEAPQDPSKDSKEHGEIEEFSQTTDEDGNKTEYTRYEDGSEHEKTTNADGSTRETTYDAKTGRTTVTETDANGKQTYSYSREKDGSSKERQVNEDGSVTETNYDAKTHKRVSQTTKDGQLIDKKTEKNVDEDGNNLDGGKQPNLPVITGKDGKPIDIDDLLRKFPSDPGKRPGPIDIDPGFRVEPKRGGPNDPGFNVDREPEAKTDPAIWDNRRPLPLVRPE